MNNSRKSHCVRTALRWDDLNEDISVRGIVEGYFQLLLPMAA
ncbi:MAG: hypothetical protein FD121_1159 [Gallionellaceae bacterium]|nr:MAG: hypothetical protein FD121_1159 [Gallionellaceae bacterium]